MDDAMTLLGILVAALLCGGLSAAIANTRSLNPKSWFFWGVVGGPLAILVLVVFPKSWLSSDEEVK
jgi:hypothetical protein